MSNGAISYIGRVPSEKNNKVINFQVLLEIRKKTLTKVVTDTWTSGWLSREDLEKFYIQLWIGQRTSCNRFSHMFDFIISSQNISYVLDNGDIIFRLFYCSIHKSNDVSNYRHRLLLYLADFSSSNLKIDFATLSHVQKMRKYLTFRRALNRFQWH